MRLLLQDWLRAKVRTNEFFLVLLALVLGIATGLVVTLLSILSQLAHVVIYGIELDVRLSAHDKIDVVVACFSLAGGGLVLGLMEWYRRRSKISPAVDPIEANALRGGRLSFRDSIVVSLQTLISNGVGASVGLEAGYTQIGSGISSLVGRSFNLRRADLRIAVGAGAAAAIAAAFDAPLTGTFYACELIVGTYSVASAAPILAAALSATLVVRSLGTNTYSLNLPDLPGADLRQYGLMIILACIISFLGIFIMRAAPMFERAFGHPRIPIWLRPVIGGLFVAGMAAITPQVLAAGHGAMVLNLSRDMTSTHIAFLMILKTVACLISLASGFRGGLFFASLFIGSLAGKLFATLLAMGPAFLHVESHISALTAMACLGVAIVGGPLTMSFLVLEMTHNLEITAGVLAACIVTSMVVRQFFGHSFSTWRLHLRGETVRGAHDVGWIRSLTVARLMRTDAKTVSRDATILECRQLYPLGSSQAIFLLDQDGSYAGTVLLADLFSSDYDVGADTRKVHEIAKYVGTILTPDMNVKIAMMYFDKAEAEILAVKDGATDHILGFVSESFARRRYVEEINRATGEVFQ
ncbi:MAG: chloride channel protein [Bradyrhizobiaceae bacterium]|nr:MAG: chloride channel protein [Bradyrhizobiaceae bacterium]